MKWIGLTGGIASGKSTVAEIISKSGIPVINADQVAHLALEPGSVVYPKIIQAFGTDILFADQSIDRNKLGAFIFKDPSQRELLEQLVHPFVRQQVQAIKKDLAQQGHKMAVYDVPLLFEKNMEKDFDHILLIFCDPETQIQRLMKRNTLTREQAELRLRSQIPLTQKKKRTIAHKGVVIENLGTLKELESKVKGWLANMNTVNEDESQLEFIIPFDALVTAVKKVKKKISNALGGKKKPAKKKSAKKKSAKKKPAIKKLSAKKTQKKVTSKKAVAQKPAKKIAKKATKSAAAKKTKKKRKS